MALEVLIVNEDRYLVNTASKGVDKICDEIISSYPMEPTLDWDIVRDIDLNRNNMTKEVKQIIDNAWANPSYEEEIVSNCCSAPELMETGLCSDCKEHAEFINLGDDD